MNKIYENPEAKVVCFQATEKLALLEHDSSNQRSSILNPSMNVNHGGKPGQN